MAGQRKRMKRDELIKRLYRMAMPESWCPNWDSVCASALLPYLGDDAKFILREFDVLTGHFDPADGQRFRVRRSGALIRLKADDAHPGYFRLSVAYQKRRFVKGASTFASQDYISDRVLDGSWVLL